MAKQWLLKLLAVVVLIAITFCALAIGITIDNKLSAKSDPGPLVTPDSYMFLETTSIEKANGFWRRGRIMIKPLCKVYQTVLINFPKVDSVRHDAILVVDVGNCRRDTISSFAGGLHATLCNFVLDNDISTFRTVKVKVASNKHVVFEKVIINNRAK